ncbi:hypothetical protein [Paraflavitalea pollutisoli]|uniref:hypothetical protein n=1 Tax=Paraflavitalea pollutisoli TaxID=3034143 RepID=UPI0023EAE44E|nr:hypothetical protein [Paraflavitalea sp. H1-2-19X]
MNIIRKILQSAHFAQTPPVLVDIGASGEINPKWKTIAPYSVCIAFDADDREFNITEEENKTYRKLLTVNRIVTVNENNTSADFYLTAFPYSSSLLEPDMEKLAPWVFKDLFIVSKKTQLPAITLTKALEQAGIQYIDWFKTDTQGTDLRIFKHLPERLQAGILVADLEPGIMDAYKGEDKLHDVMAEMDKHVFWLSSMKVLGTQRLNASLVPSIGSFLSKRVIRKSPGWAEVTYLRQPQVKTERSLLLQFVFALLEKQYGFALEIAACGTRQYNTPIFKECEQAVWRKIRSEKLKAPLVILKRQVNKLFGNLID